MGRLLKQVGKLNGLSAVINKGDYSMLLYPIAQIGNIIFPDIFLPFRRGAIPNSYILTRNLLPSLIIAVLLIYLTTYKFTKNMRRYFIPATLLVIFWIFFVQYIFRMRITNPIMQPSDIQAFINGGLFLIFNGIIFIFATPKFKVYILTMLLLLMLSFIVPWVRFPHVLHETIGRYLIISSVASTGLIIIIFYVCKNKILFSIFILLPLILINIKSSRIYLSRLAIVRNYHRTEKIRRSVPLIPTLSKKGETTLVYFKADNNEVLYHAIMFGFPVITSYYQNVDNIWNVAYTQDWNEIIGAYTTGEGLRRFGTIPVKPVPIENIYSFRLDYDHLVDTTAETRGRLLDL